MVNNVINESEHFILLVFKTLRKCYSSNEYTSIYSLYGIQDRSKKFFDKNSDLLNMELSKLGDILSSQKKSQISFKIKILSFLTEVSGFMYGSSENNYYAYIGKLHYHIAKLLYRIIIVSSVDETKINQINWHYNKAHENFGIIKNDMKLGELNTYYANMIEDTLYMGDMFLISNPHNNEIKSHYDNLLQSYYKNALSYFNQLEVGDAKTNLFGVLTNKISDLKNKEIGKSLLGIISNNIHKHINDKNISENIKEYYGAQLRVVNLLSSNLESIVSNENKALELLKSKDAILSGEEVSITAVETNQLKQIISQDNIEVSKQELQPLAAELKYSNHVSIPSDGKTLLNIPITNGETTQSYKITSQDTYYASYFFSKLFLKPFIQCKNNEYKVIDSSLDKHNYDYTTCVVNQVFDSNNLIMAAVSPSIYLINKFSSPEMILLNTVSMHLLYAAYSVEDYFSYITDSILQCASNYILMYPSFLLMQQNNLVPQENFWQASLTGILTPIAKDLFELGSNFFFNDDANISSLT